MRLAVAARFTVRIRPVLLTSVVSARLLRSGAALTAGLAAGWGAEIAWPTSALAQTQMTRTLRCRR